MLRIAKKYTRIDIIDPFKNIDVAKLNYLDESIGNEKSVDD